VRRLVAAFAVLYLSNLRNLWMVFRWTASS
jgi:hypothetical protein